MLEILNELASTPSRLAKEAILSRECNNKLLKEVIDMAINPFYVYYIKQIPSYIKSMQSDTNDLAWALTRLKNIANREVTGSLAIDHLVNTLESVSPDDAEVVERAIPRSRRMVSSAG